MSGGLPSCDVAIVGAGLTGLVAAEALTSAGARVVVLEARERVGGRAFSARRDSGAIDLGASWFWPGETCTQALSDALETFPQHLAGDALFEADGRGVQRLDGNPIDAPSYRFAAGAQALAEQMAERLPLGVLRVDEPVHALDVYADGVLVQTGGESLRAKHVIVAVPPALAVERIAFTPALPSDVRAASEATAVWMGAMVKTVAVYERAFWRDTGLSGSAISYAGPFREFHDHSGPDAAPAAIFGFAPAAAFDRSTGLNSIAGVFTEQLVRLFGSLAAHPLHVDAVDWSREEHTSPRSPSPTAGTETYGAPVFRQRVHERIVLASTETAAAHAGHLEGAIRAGREAARLLGF